MTAWESIVSDQIDAIHRQRVTDSGLEYGPYPASQNLNAAILACRSPSSPPLSALLHVPHPAGDEVGDWREWMRDRYRDKMASKHYSEKRNALLDVWSEAERAHHFIKGSLTPSGYCAACDAELSRFEPAFKFLDGARTHRNATCPGDYDAKWRATAKAGLIEMGLKCPE